jgi:hypothetical protein
LESIGQQIQNGLTETNNYQLRDKIYLVACLLEKINEDIELPAQAVSGLADLFYRMQNLCGYCIKQKSKFLKINFAEKNKLVFK